MGGLLKYVTKQPDTHHLSGSLEAGTNVVRDGGQGASGRVSLNAPIKSDTIALTASGFYRYDGGWLTEVPTSVTALDRKSTAGASYNVNDRTT